MKRSFDPKKLTTDAAEKLLPVCRSSDTMADAGNAAARKLLGCFHFSHPVLNAPAFFQHSEPVWVAVGAVGSKNIRRPLLEEASA